MSHHVLALLAEESLSDSNFPEAARRGRSDGTHFMRQGEDHTFMNDSYTIELRRYMVFDHWEHLMDFMIRGLELESQVDTS
jgi:hypothetical protein